MPTDNKPLRERDIEAYLVKRVKELGGETRKCKWIGRVGAPDRVVFFYGTHFFEIKAPGKEPRPEQEREHTAMRARGASVFVVDSIEGVRHLLAVLMLEGTAKC